MRLLIALLAAATPAQAAFNFGLGKSAAKKTATAVGKAIEKSSGSFAGASGAPASSGRLKWAYLGEPVQYASPAVGRDGAVYFATSHHFMHYFASWKDGKKPPAVPYGLYCYNPDGTQRWKYSDGTDAPARGSPVLAPDGTVYIVLERLGTSSADAELHAVHPDGRGKWKAVLGGYAEIGSLTPALGPDGTIYVAGKNLLRAFSPDGALKWARNTKYYYGSPAVGPDGAVYTIGWTGGFGDSQVVMVFGPDGAPRWTSEKLGTYPITASPVLGPDGTVYIGTYDSYWRGGGPGTAFFAISSTGGIKWAFPAGDGDIRSSAAIAADGTLYFGTIGPNGFIYALNADGTLQWRYKTRDDAVGGGGTDVYSSPAIGGDGTVYAASEWGYLYAFNPDGSVKWKDKSLVPQAGGTNWSSPALADDGTLYVGKTYGAFLAVKTDSPGLSLSAPWPRFRASNSNAGRK